MQWKYFLALLLAFSLLLPVYSESETDLEIEMTEVPVLEAEAIYEMKGQDIMILYQTIKNLNETKNEYESLIDETMTVSKNVMTLNKELGKENKKLTLQNNFLIGTTVCSVGIGIAGVIVFACTNIK